MELSGYVLVTAACLFFSAGRLDWWNAWLYLGLSVAMMIGTGALLVRHSPELIAERAMYRPDAKRWDKWLSGSMTLCGPTAVWIVSGLDARNYWSDRLPGFATALGVMLMTAGLLLVVWAMLSNPFFSTFVRIQKERGHKVAAGGPYRYVRHPGYVGMIASTMAAPLVLGSIWAFAPAAITAALTVLRTALEDWTLRRELDGYLEYTRRVRWRLAPWVW